MTTISEWLAEATDVLHRSEVSSPRLDAILLLEFILKMERSSLLAHDTDSIKVHHLAQLNLLLEQRSLRTPLAYLLKSREFYGLNFTVDEHVLIPRPETEILVEYAIRYIPKNTQVLEIGTGSGCISIALAKNRPDLSIRATDVSFEALSVAQGNNESIGTSVTFQRSDLFEGVRGTFDAILANLPYVPELARRQPEITFEPDISLYGGDDGLDLYRVFFRSLKQYLSPSGVCLVEFSPTQYKAVREFCKPLGIDVQPLSEYIYRAHSL